MLLRNLRMVGIVRTEGSRLDFNSRPSSCFIVEITGMEKKKKGSVWWCTPIIPGLRKTGRFLLKHSRFYTSQGCTHQMSRQGLTNKYDMVRLPCPV